MKKINYEKISVYVACLTLAVMLWNSLLSIKNDIADVRERVAVLETRVAIWEKK